MFFQLFYVKDFTYRSTKYTYKSEWNRKSRNSVINDCNENTNVSDTFFYYTQTKPVHNLSPNSIYTLTYSYFCR